MEANSTEVLEHAKALNSLVQAVDSDVNQFAACRGGIIEAAEKIVIAARGGGENLYKIANAVCYST